MNKTNKIYLPRSVLRTYYARARCPKHFGVGVNEECLLFAGIGRASDGTLCFSVEWQCIVCRKPHRAQFPDHSFAKLDWWNELAGWHDSAPSVEQQAMNHKVARQKLPKIGPMVLSMAGLESVWIRGGYKGDVGPIMLVFEGTEPNSMAGVLRLERNSQVSLFDDSEAFCLPGNQFGRFSAIDDGGMFPLDGQTWIKMSVREIESIIRDRVFDVALEDDELIPTPRPKTRSAHDTHVKKSRKGTRRSPRNSRPLDS